MEVELDIGSRHTIHVLSVFYERTCDNQFIFKQTSRAAKSAKHRVRMAQYACDMGHSIQVYITSFDGMGRPIRTEDSSLLEDNRLAGKLTMFLHTCISNLTQQASFTCRNSDG